MLFLKNKIFIILAVLLLAMLGYFFYKNYSCTESGDELKLKFEDFIKKEEAHKSSLKNLGEKVVSVDDEDHIWGIKEAKVEIIVYSAFTCEFCFDFYEIINQVKAGFEGDVKITFRHFPLKKNGDAWLASLVSECASRQGKFWEMHDVLFEKIKLEHLDKDKIIKYSDDLGLDTDKMEICLEENNTKKIEKDIYDAQILGVIGTPSVFVNDIFYPGAYPMDDFVDDRGDEKKGLRSIIKSYLK